MRHPSPPEAPTGRPRPPRDEHLLRLLDAGLALCALTLLALPMLLAGRLAPLRREPMRGRGGALFDRLGLDLPATLAGRCWRALGAAAWPRLFNILRGELAWVGPRPRAPGEPPCPALAHLRPGLVNPWFIRRRTAAALGGEDEADAHYLAHRGLRHDLGVLLRAALVALLPAERAATPGRVRVCDVAFDNLDMTEALQRLEHMLDGQGARQVSFVNPACVNVAASNRPYRRALAQADLVLPDGIGIKLGSDLLGSPLKQNVNGTDLFPRLCDRLQARGASVFLLGGRPGVPQAVAEQIRRRWPGLRVAGLRDGYFDLADEGAVVAQVRGSGADVLLVARGVPVQDVFIHRHLPLLGVKLALGVGGLFDFVSGRIPRAPVWMRESGLEWVYRLRQEPLRLWRRYLVGNLAFLARVLAQRWGWRRALIEAGRPDPAATGAEAATRAVLFATGTAAGELPVPADWPAALLPLGCQTVIERVMERLAGAAVTDVTVVASDRPEALRARLGDGARWGLRLHWQVVKDPGRPYGMLRQCGDSGTGRVLIGHADRCPSAGLLRRLMGADTLPMEADDPRALRWSGWASVAAAGLCDLPGDLDERGLAHALAGAGLPMGVCEAGDCLHVDGGQALHRAQFAARAATDADDGVPASWVRRPWGAMSPLAHVAEGAVLHGPVFIGAGCVVERGAQVGPQVVLTQDVVVSAGTHIVDSVVLPNSYVGGGLDLCQTVVNGERALHWRLGAQTCWATGDALLLSLAAARRRGWLSAGRLGAGAALLLAGPVALAALGARGLAGRPLPWTWHSVVAGRDALTQQWQVVGVRRALNGGTPAGRAWGAFAGLLDVAAGRRRWFGVRPRTRSAWYALRHEWQDILDGAPIGLLHAPAWADGDATVAEAGAAADVLCTVLPWWQRSRLMLSALWREGCGLARAMAGRQRGRGRAGPALLSDRAWQPPRPDAGRPPPCPARR